MRYALIDNATLTSIQRILGHIPIKDRYIIESDMLALESYIQAILFYDTLLCIDDYKEDLRQSRKAFFPHVRMYNLPSTTYHKLLKTTQVLTSRMVPKVEAGHFTDEDFRTFFDFLRMNITFTWDMSSSVYFLTIKMLESPGGIDIDKYGQLASMIHNEVLNKQSSATKYQSPKPILLDRHGEPLTYDSEYEGLQQQTQHFFAGLSWLAFRTMFYTLLANELGFDLYLHPIRQSFQINVFHKMQIYHEPIYKSLLQAMHDEGETTFKTIMSLTKPFITDDISPMFTAWLIREIDNPNQLIQAGYTLRQEPLFIQARQTLIELETMLEEHDLHAFTKKSNKLVKSIKNDMQRIRAQYHVATPQGIALSRIVSVWNLSTVLTRLPQIPEARADVPLFTKVDALLPKRGFKAIYRKLIHDLVAIERLGKLYDRITANVVFDEDATYYQHKIEEQRYYNKESYWKKRM